jgi:hypothetical protein
VDKAEVAQLFKKIKKRYPNFDASLEEVQECHKYLNDIPYELAEQNVDRHIRASRYYPGISEIRGDLGDQDEHQREIAETQAYLREREASRKQATLPPTGWRDTIIARLRGN